MEFSFEALIFIGVVFLLEAFIHGSIGFGFPMVATPLLALSTDIQTAIVLTLIPTLLVNLISIISEGNILVAVRRHFLLALLAMLGSAVGTQILLTVNSDIFKVLLGVVIIIYLLAEKIKLKLSWIREHPKFSKFTFGLSAGIIGGLTNIRAGFNSHRSCRKPPPVKSNVSNFAQINPGSLAFGCCFISQLFYIVIPGNSQR